MLKFPLSQTIHHQGIAMVYPNRNLGSALPVETHPKVR